MAGLYAPLPTLRRRPRGRLRTDRGRRGLLLLHRSGLSPHTPCQSPGALTRVAACTLARSPNRDPITRGFRHFVSSMPAPVASGGSDFAGWASHPLESAALARRTPIAGIVESSLERAGSAAQKRRTVPRLARSCPTIDCNGAVVSDPNTSWFRSVGNA